MYFYQRWKTWTSSQSTELSGPASGPRHPSTPTNRDLSSHFPNENSEAIFSFTTSSGSGARKASFSSDSGSTSSCPSDKATVTPLISSPLRSLPNSSNVANLSLAPLKGVTCHGRSVLDNSFPLREEQRLHELELIEEGREMERAKKGEWKEINLLVIGSRLCGKNTFVRELFDRPEWSLCRVYTNGKANVTTYALTNCLRAINVHVFVLSDLSSLSLFESGELSVKDFRTLFPLETEGEEEKVEKRKTREREGRGERPGGRGEGAKTDKAKDLKQGTKEGSKKPDSKRAKSSSKDQKGGQRRAEERRGEERKGEERNGEERKGEETKKIHLLLSLFCAKEVLEACHWNYVKNFLFPEREIIYLLRATGSLSSKLKTIPVVTMIDQLVSSMQVEMVKNHLGILLRSYRTRVFEMWSPFCGLSGIREEGEEKGEKKKKEKGKEEKKVADKKRERRGNSLWSRFPYLLSSGEKTEDSQDPSTIHPSDEYSKTSMKVEKELLERLFHDFRGSTLFPSPSQEETNREEKEDEATKKSGTRLVPKQQPKKEEGETNLPSFPSDIKGPSSTSQSRKGRELTGREGRSNMAMEEEERTRGEQGEGLRETNIAIPYKKPYLGKLSTSSFVFVYPYRQCLWQTREILNSVTSSMKWILYPPLLYANRRAWATSCSCGLSREEICSLSSSSLVHLHSKGDLLCSRASSGGWSSQCPEGKKNGKGSNGSQLVSLLPRNSHLLPLPSPLLETRENIGDVLTERHDLSREQSLSSLSDSIPHQQSDDSTSTNHSHIEDLLHAALSERLLEKEKKARNRQLGYNVESDDSAVYINSSFGTSSSYLLGSPNRLSTPCLLSDKCLSISVKHNCTCPLFMPLPYLFSEPVGTANFFYSLIFRVFYETIFN